MSEDGTLSIQVVGHDFAYSMEVTSALGVREFADWITRQVASFRERDTNIRACRWVPVHHSVARPVREGIAARAEPRSPTAKAGGSRHQVESGGCVCEVGDPYPRGGKRPGESMVFIAHARTDVPAMADEIERLRGLLAEARGYVVTGCVHANAVDLIARIDAALPNGGEGQ